MIHVPADPRLHILFDAAAWLSGLALARGLYAWRLEGRIAQAAAKVGPGYFLALGLGAAAGGYAAGSLVSLDGPAPGLSHSIIGVLAGAILAVEGYKALRRVRGSTGSAFVGPLALGIAIGRWGCLAAGLPDRTFGSPTRLPWAVELGDGIGRHPVQVYESLAMAGFLLAYLAGLYRRRPWALRRGFYAFAAWYGAQRFLWEFLKPYPRLIGGLDLFQLMALGLVAYGCIFFLRDRAAEGREEGRPLPLLRPDHEPV